jgi:nucleotide-binding universal stress UspA family protein
MKRGQVVAGICDSPANAATLAWALAEAESTGAELVVVRADERRREVWGAVARNSLSALEIVDRPLARAVAAARARLGEERVTVIVDRDAPGDLLVERAQPSDLVVLGAPRHPGWWARGSTTYAVATRGRCPVVVVHGPDSLSHPAGGHLFAGHVVVGIDGSPPARAALGFAFAYAAEHHRPLAAVTVTRHTGTEVWFDDTMLETHLVEEPEAAKALAAELEPWHHKDPSVELRRAVLNGSPVDGLRRMSGSAHLLVVGTAGTGPAAMGSVSRGLVDEAPCPVAIVREFQ